MADYVLLDGDMALFLPTFGVATVIVQPGKLVASGPATLAGKQLCIDGDEQSVAVRGCMYMTPQHSIPGVGTLEIAALGRDQKATQTRSDGKPVLLLGATFQAKFSVMTPAQQPPPGPGPPIPDAQGQYSGTGTFRTTNTKLRGT